MGDTVNIFISKRPQTSQVVEDYKAFLRVKNIGILEATEENIADFREELLSEYSRANATERLLIIRDLYLFIRRKASIAQYLRYAGIILLQAFTIYSSSVWMVPKYPWTSFLWLDRLSVFLFGSEKIFFYPGMIGSIVAFGIVLILVARGWLERPRNFLAWIVLVLNWWIIAVLYGLILGNEAFINGTLTGYAVVIAVTAMVLGYKQIVGYAVLAIIVIAGFNITTITTKLEYMVLPYLASLFFALFAQNPEIFDKLLEWINRQFLSGKAQDIGRKTAESVQNAAKTIGETVKRAGDIALKAGLASSGVPVVPSQKSKLLD
jgi:hypothetical protein